MTDTTRSPTPSASTQLRVPHPKAGLSNYRIALLFAKNGWYVVPTSPSDPKNPGSLFRGRDWREFSTRDPEKIREYWTGGGNEVRGIYLHAGKSGAVIFDVDSPKKFPEWMKKELRGAPYFTTSESKARRHWIVLQPEGRTIGNSLGNLPRGWGEIRGLGGGIAVYPTVHLDQVNPGNAKDPADLGVYGIGRRGVAIPMPAALGAKLVDAHQDNSEPATNQDVETFLSTYDGSTHLPALKGPLHYFENRDGNRYDFARDALCWAMREAYAGAYPARDAHDALKSAYRDSLDAPGRNFSEAEWARLTRFAVSVSLDSDPAATRAKLDRDKPVAGRPILTFMSSGELAEPVDPVEFYINGAIVKDSFGPNAGPKKSLKTHTNQAVAVATASGLDLFGCSEFKVPQPVSVLYIVGEGGQRPIRRLLQRMCVAYGVELRDLPLTAAFGAADINSPQFLDEVKSGLDRAQPGIVLLESFFNFHPADVETGKLHTRGRLIQEYHEAIRAEVQGATSILTDHFRSTNNSLLDLDTISMAGQAESADSWILGTHLKPPAVADGEFRMLLQFGSRQWGNRDWEVDWSLGKFDVNLGHHIGDISWNVRPADSTAATGERSKVGDSDITNAVVAYVESHPGDTKKSAVDYVSAELKVGDKRVRKAFTDLADSGQIKPQRGKVQEGGREVEREVWVRSDGKRRVRKAGS